MIDINSFAVLGGDRRQVALAESIASDGYTVYAVGFDQISFQGEVRKAPLDEAAAKCENIILPLPVTNDGVRLNIVYSDAEIILDDDFARRMQHKQVFGGMMGRLYPTSELWDSIDTNDYYTREELIVQNAVPTAEGAIGIAIREFPGTVHGSRCLVAGFGRVGKMLASMLHGLGAKVTAAARSKADLAWIASYGYTPVALERMCAGEEYDLIFNTVPAMVFSRKVLSKLRNSPLIIDLSSMPGGVDYEAAEKMQLKVIHALSLPGKVAPRAAGESIKNTIYNIMEE